MRRDPSQTTMPIETSAASSGGVAWVRPTELAMRIGAPVAGRGIDLQTALSERARRAPAAMAGHHGVQRDRRLLGPRLPHLKGWGCESARRSARRPRVYGCCWCGFSTPLLGRGSGIRRPKS